MKILVNSTDNKNFTAIPLFLDESNKLTYGKLDNNIRNLIINDEIILSDQGSYKKYHHDNKELLVVNAGIQNNESIRLFISTVVKQAKLNNSTNINIDLRFLDLKKDDKEIVEVIAESLFIVNYNYDLFKSKKNPTLDSVNIILENNIQGYENTLVEAKNIGDSLNLVRDLVNGPANIVTIKYMEETALEIAKKNNLNIKIYDENELKFLGMNLILGVGSGSNQQPRLIEMSYTPEKSVYHAVIVGKGVVFDAGGLDLKSPDNMLGMKIDMAGGATALGIIDIIAAMKLNVSVTVLIPLVENFVSSKSYRPGDVIKSYSGKTIEINNTDAEGRLILADALAFATSKSPDIIIDIATLTGASIIALGSRITAGFFTNEEQRNGIFSAAMEKGENIWELPLNNEYKNYLKSKIADLSNIGNPPREGGCIIAALFLKEFVGDANWVHLDIAGTAFSEKEWKYHPCGATGYMMRTIYEFLKRQ